MIHLLIVANWLLPMLYLALLIDYGKAFFLRTPRPCSACWLAAVWVLHAGFLVLLGVHLGRLVPVNNYEVLSALAASMTAVYWLIELASGERRTGVFVLLTAFLLQYTASVFLPAADLAGGAPSGEAASFHMIPAIVAYTALTLAAIYGALHLAAQRDLKRRRFGLLFDRLPPLELLGRMNWHAALAGLAFITLSIVSGAVFYAAGHGEAAAGGPSTKVMIKILAGALAWVIYAIAAGGKWLGGWSPSRVSMLTVAGFLVVAAMLVASIVLP